MVFPAFPSFSIISNDSDRTTSQEEADDSEESHAAHSRVVQAIPDIVVKVLVILRHGGVKFQQIIGG